MIRLHAVVEGQTEEAFFNSVLVPHLAGHGVAADVQLINPRAGSNARLTKGGWNSYTVIKRHLGIWMKQDQTAIFTTMVDLYRIPTDFPDFAEVRKTADAAKRVEALERGWLAEMGDPENRRFIPYIQLHEFEALILSDPAFFDWEFIEDGHTAPIERLKALAAGFDTPEAINDGPETAPSKRIIKEIPAYAARKVSAGPLIASKIGLPTLRARCPHFDRWVARLESLASPPSD